MSGPSMSPGFAARPDYLVDIRRRRNRVTVRHGEVLLADTVVALLVDEQDHGLVFYIPRADVRTDQLVPDGTTSHCPFKGEASYWKLPDGDGPIAWEYRTPYAEVARITDHIAFYQDRVELRVGVADPAVLGR